jgi:hypothetical protein
MTGSLFIESQNATRKGFGNHPFKTLLQLQPALAARQDLQAIANLPNGDRRQEQRPNRSGGETARFKIWRTSSSMDTPCRTARTRSWSYVSSSSLRMLKLAKKYLPEIDPEPMLAHAGK